jgi:hypothetical protein
MCVTSLKNRSFTDKDCFMQIKHIVYTILQSKNHIPVIIVSPEYFVVNKAVSNLVICFLSVFYFKSQLFCIIQTYDREDDLRTEEGYIYM